MSTKLSTRGCKNTGKVEASLPEGFQDQLNQVVRAVLLGQPASQVIYRFVADFLDAQLDDRVRRECELENNAQPTPDNSPPTKPCDSTVPVEQPSQPPSPPAPAARAAAPCRGSVNMDPALRSADRGTQTTSQYDRVTECPPTNTSRPPQCPPVTSTTRPSCPPATTRPAVDSGNQTAVDVPCCDPSDPSLFHRSVYSGWTAPDPVDNKSESECEESSKVEQVDSSKFDDSVTDDRQLTAAVRQCRQHIDDIGTEAQSMERLLADLQTGTPQRQAVLEAVQKLDSLRQHINETQKLLNNVDALLRRACDQQAVSQSPSTQPGGSTPQSRSELLQRELGRLNSRLCCTVLALERATSKAICRGTQSGVVATTRSAAERLSYCCASGIQKPASSTASDQAHRNQSQASPAPAVTSQSVPDKNTSAPPRTAGLCEQWLNSQRQESIPPLLDDTQSCETIEKTAAVPVTSASPHPSLEHRTTEPQPAPASQGASLRRNTAPAISPPFSNLAATQPADDGAALGEARRTTDSTPTDTQHDPQTVSLKEIHRMLGSIISNIDQPCPDDQQPSAAPPPSVARQTPAVEEAAERRAEEVASNPSVMTDSTVASSTDLQEALMAVGQTETRDGPLALRTLPSDATGFDDRESCWIMFSCRPAEEDRASTRPFYTISLATNATEDWQQAGL